MQKLDYVTRLSKIVDDLMCEDVVFKITNFVGSSSNKVIVPRNLGPMLLEIKSAFDRLQNDKLYSPFLRLIDPKIYEAAQILDLAVRVNAGLDEKELKYADTAYDFLRINQSLIFHRNLARELLVDIDIVKSLKEDNGLIVFQIMIDGDGLPASKYIKIFSALNDLVDVVSKIYREPTQDAEVILLDSGSDTNLGIKAGVETAKGLVSLFREILDLAVNFRYYKEQRKQQALIDSLKTMAIIKTMVDDKILNPAEAMQYRHTIKTRTDELLGLGVVPKELILENEETPVTSKFLKSASILYLPDSEQRE